jgi:hypothetical protein
VRPPHGVWMAVRRLGAELTVVSILSPQTGQESTRCVLGTHREDAHKRAAPAQEPYREFRVLVHRPAFIPTVVLEQRRPFPNPAEDAGVDLELRAGAPVPLPRAAAPHRRRECEGNGTRHAAVSDWQLRAADPSSSAPLTSADAEVNVVVRIHHVASRRTTHRPRACLGRERKRLRHHSTQVPCLVRSVDSCSGANKRTGIAPNARFHNRIRATENLRNPERIYAMLKGTLRIFKERACGLIVPSRKARQRSSANCAGANWLPSGQTPILRPWT